MTLRFLGEVLLWRVAIGQLGLDVTVGSSNKGGRRSFRGGLIMEWHS